MRFKIIPLFSVILISVLAFFFLSDSTSVDRELLSKTLIVDAVYFEDEGYVEISFEDKSKKTSNVVLEVLGLPESFQKVINKSNFVEKVPFPSTPKYGWETHPVTFVIDHEEFGKIGLKTEIHPQGEPSSPIIFSKL